MDGKMAGKCIQPAAEQTALSPSQRCPKRGLWANLIPVLWDAESCSIIHLAYMMLICSNLRGCVLKLAFFQTQPSSKPGLCFSQLVLVNRYLAAAELF